MKKITSDNLNQSIKQVEWINSKGQKQISYYLKYTFNGKRRNMKIANGGTSIQLVRKIASELQARMLLETDFDPLNRKTDNLPTLNNLFNKYLQQLRLNKRKTISEYVR